ARRTRGAAHRPRSIPDARGHDDRRRGGRRRRSCRGLEIVGRQDYLHHRRVDMSTFALFVAMVGPAIFVAAALAQTQLPPPAGRSSPPRGATTPAPESENAVEGRI